MHNSSIHTIEESLFEYFDEIPDNTDGHALTVYAAKLFDEINGKDELK